MSGRGGTGKESRARWSFNWVWCVVDKNNAFAVCLWLIQWVQCATHKYTLYECPVDKILICFCPSSSLGWLVCITADSFSWLIRIIADSFTWERSTAGWFAWTVFIWEGWPASPASRSQPIRLSIGSTHMHDLSIPTYDPFLVSVVYYHQAKKERRCFLFSVKCCQVRWWVGLLLSRPPHLSICRPDAEMRDGGPWIHPCPVAHWICSCGQYKLAKHGWTWTAS